MTRLTEPAVISWGDPTNFCTVSRAEVRGEELILVVHVEGLEHPPEDTEVSALGAKRICLPGRPGPDGANCMPPTPPSDGGARREVTLAFDCPAALQCAEDVLFSYAPGYGCVSILDIILSSLVRSAPSMLPLGCSAGANLKASTPNARWPLRSSASGRTWTVADDALWQVTPEPGNQQASPSTAAVRPAPVLRQLQPQAQPQDAPAQPSYVKLEDAEVLVGGGQGGIVVEPLRSPSCASLCSPSASSSASCEAFFTETEAGHSRTLTALERRLVELRRLMVAWQEGDWHGFSNILEVSRDEALLYGALQRLQAHVWPLPPSVLARLLPLAQRLSQSSHEAHAVVAMRFATESIEASWPAISRALQKVATPKAAFDDCQSAVQSVTALYAMVKKMANSVRISRTNGPLVPVCRKLKSTLEQALVAVGRLRGGC